MTTRQPERPAPVSTGVSGLDDLLRGGLPQHRLHLVQGAPGTGKTTLALEFLLDGVARGERVLYVTLAETTSELEEVAASHGWDLTGVTMVELAPSSDSLRPEQQFTVIHAADVEFNETIWSVLEEVERVQPQRLVFDSMAELKLIANDISRYRRQVLALKQFFAGRGCTVLLLDNIGDLDTSVESIAHSVIRLHGVSLEHGGIRRRLEVMKVRGVDYRTGLHDYEIRESGLQIFPRLVAADHREGESREARSTGIEELDELLGGGLVSGTATLVIGPAGAGKTVLMTKAVIAAAERGERAAVFLFEEGLGTLLAQADGLELPLRSYIESGFIAVHQVDAGQLSPGEFDFLIRGAVEEREAQFIAIDSLNGYLRAMTQEQLVLAKLHELQAYLARHLVTTMITLTQSGLVGEMRSPVDVSYLADTVILLRHFELRGVVRIALSVMKKRTGRHERTIRELQVRGGGVGLRIGAALSDFRGIIQGTPVFVGSEDSLLSSIEGE